MKRFLIFFIIICIASSGCSTLTKNLEISNVQLTPGKEIVNLFDNKGTGVYDLSILSFVITNKGSKTDPGHYMISARVYDKNGNFISKPIGDVGYSLEPGESRSVKLFFGNIDPKNNLNFAAINIGKIEVIFNYFTNDGKNSDQVVYTFNF